MPHSTGTPAALVHTPSYLVQLIGLVISPSPLTDDEHAFGFEEILRGHYQAIARWSVRDTESGWILSTDIQGRKLDEVLHRSRHESMFHQGVAEDPWTRIGQTCLMPPCSSSISAGLNCFLIFADHS